MRHQILAAISAIGPLALAPAANAQGNAPSGECIDHTPQECISSIRRVGKVLFTNLADKMPLQAPRDVNGQVIGEPPVITAWFRLPSDQSYIQRAAGMHLDANGKVWRVKIDIYGDPSSASTETEFDRTGIGAMAAAFLPQSCSVKDKASFHREFYNRVKPTIRSEPRSTYVGVDSASDTIKQSSGVSNVCGIGVSYESERGMDTSRISSTSSGTFNDRYIVFSRLPSTSSIDSCALASAPWCQKLDLLGRPRL